MVYFYTIDQVIVVECKLYVVEYCVASLNILTHVPWGSGQTIPLTRDRQSS